MTFTATGAKDAKDAKDENELSMIVFGWSGTVGNAYEACLAYELRNEGLTVSTQVPLPLIYREVRLDAGYRLDLLVEDMVVVEIKAVDALGPSIRHR
jgi:GxxExxY protein